MSGLFRPFTGIFKPKTFDFFSRKFFLCINANYSAVIKLDNRMPGFQDWPGICRFGPPTPGRSLFSLIENFRSWVL
jgi:hypothetical protein